MGFYTNKIMPRLMNAAMSEKSLEKLRQEVLREAKGEVLEIGFGSGLNLPFYPKSITHLTAVDVNPGMEKLSRKVLDGSPVKVDYLLINGEQLPFPAASFDTVVSTWTLCSIERVDQALNEIKRVLKPGGKFFFIEHGLSKDEKVQKWQNRLNGLQRKMAGNCHLNRPIRALIEGQGFNIAQLNEFYIEKSPKYMGYFYQGFASPA